MTKEKFYHLYKITNIINNKIYIGQTIQPEKRWNQHRRDSANPKLPFHFAIQKHGAHNFIFEVIAICKTLEDADWLEEELIKQYESHVSMGKGYNSAHGGANAPKSEAWKQKIKEHWQRPEYRESILSKMHEGRIEQLQYLKENNLPIPGTFQEGHAPNSGTFTSGHVVGEETKQKQSEIKKGKPLSEEHKKSLNEAQKKVLNNSGRFQSGHPAPKTAFKIGMTPWNLGKTHSEEAKKKMSESRKGKIRVQFTSEQIDEMKHLFAEGNSLRKIAKQFLITHQTVKKLIQQ